MIKAEKVFKVTGSYVIITSTTAVWLVQPAERWKQYLDIVNSYAHWFYALNNAS